MFAAKVRRPGRSRFVTIIDAIAANDRLGCKADAADPFPHPNDHDGRRSGCRVGDNRAVHDKSTRLGALSRQLQSLRGMLHDHCGL
jgi:hypothetical protein